jgi:nucleoside phosphorylase
LWYQEVGKTPLLVERSNSGSRDQGPRQQGKCGNPKLRHEEYTVGWLCALKCEFNAARLLLEEIHKTLAQVRRDDNIYLLGRMKGHNVVIAQVGRGTNAAAHAATNLLRTFPNIRFGLMVGIGGGAPSAPNTRDPQKDIRLGDVIVSRAKGSHGRLDPL